MENDRTKSRRRNMAEALSLVRTQSSDELKEVLQLVKETDARSRVLFQKVHNLQVSFDQLAKEYDGLLAVLKELMSRPDEMTPAEHIVADFLQNKYGRQRNQPT